jgi:hypothetical protein
MTVLLEQDSLCPYIIAIVEKPLVQMKEIKPQIEERPSFRTKSKRSSSQRDNLWVNT